MRFLLLLCCFSGFCTALKAQRKNPARRLPDKVAPADLAKDIDVLYDVLKKSHPRYDQYTPAATFDSIYRAERAWSLLQKDSISNGQAYLHLSQMVGAVRDGHTYFTRALKRTGFTQPKVALGYLNNEYVIANPDPADSVFLYAKCLRINGLAMDSLPTSWERVRTGDGWNETFPKRITGMYVFDYYQAQFGATDTWRFEALCRDGITRTLEVKGKKWWPSKAERKTEKQEEDRKKAQKKTARDTTAADLTLYRHKKAALLYRPHQDTSVVVMKINTFAFGRYRPFYRKSFRYLKEYPPRLFIVDVRENLGGKVNNVGDLLGYLQPKPYEWKIARRKKIIHPANCEFLFARLFLKKILKLRHVDRQGNFVRWSRTFRPHEVAKRYQPQKLVVLHNSFSFSGGSVTASVLKNLCGATAIGNETGGGEVQLNALISQKIKLPHSGMRLTVAGYSIDMEVGKTDQGRGVLPDIKVLPTVESLKANRDAMLEAALRQKK